jgi:hypothetical protein
VIGLCILLAAASCLFGCLGEGDPEAGTSVPGSGMIVLVAEEGGFYGILADDGNRYYPINLDERYKVHGLRVVFRVTVRGDIFTIQQWGIPVEIEEIAFEVQEGSSGPVEIDDDTIIVYGTMIFTPDDGGYWMVRGDDSKLYRPVNLDDEYRKEGIVVIFEGVVVNTADNRSGTAVRILEIASVD